MSATSSAEISATRRSRSVCPARLIAAAAAFSQDSVLVPISYFYESSSYLKLRNVSLGYTVPDSALARVHVAKLRIYLEGTNLLIFKPGSTTLRDPEVIPGASFPIPKTFTVGLNGSF